MFDGQGTVDEVGLKECRNPKCSRYLVIVYLEHAGRRRKSKCKVCHSRLKPASYDVSRLDAPPLIEGYEGDSMDSKEEIVKINDHRRSQSGYVTNGSTTNFDNKPKPNDTFTCEADISGCPIANKLSPPRVDIPDEMFGKWIWLTKRFDTEWIAFLKGSVERIVEGGVQFDYYKITDMYFPKQKCTPSHVEAIDGQIQEGTIAAVHSHVNMGAFFSAEDERHANHAVELVVNRKGELACSVRVKLECGRYERTRSAKVYLMGNNEAAVLATQLEAQIEEEKPYYNPRGATETEADRRGNSTGSH